MAFEQNLTTFNFNKETLEMMVDEKMDKKEIVESMEMAGFNEGLTNFLMETDPVFYNSVMLRMKLYGKQNKDLSHVKKAFNNFKNTLPLVDYLFNDSVTSKVKKDTVKETDNKVHLIEENVETASDVQSDAESVDSADSMELEPLDKFYQNFIKESEGSELKTKETYEAFTKWYVEHFDEDETPDKKEFKNFLSEKLGKSGKKGWADYTLVA